MPPSRRAAKAQSSSKAHSSPQYRLLRLSETVLSGDEFLYLGSPPSRAELQDPNPDTHLWTPADWDGYVQIGRTLKRARAEYSLYCYPSTVPSRLCPRPYVRRLLPVGA